MNYVVLALAFVGLLALATLVGCWLAKREPVLPHEPPCSDPECCDVGREAAERKRRHDAKTERVHLTMAEWRERWDAERRKTGGTR